MLSKSVSELKLVLGQNQRELFALKRQTIFIIVLSVFCNYTQEEVLKISMLEIFLVFFLLVNSTPFSSQRKNFGTLEMKLYLVRYPNPSQN